MSHPLARDAATPADAPAADAPAAPRARLVVAHLSKKFGRKDIVKDVSITVNPGEVVGLLGANGAGKTTCFNMIAGTIKPSSGWISLDGKDISDLPPYRRARLGLAYLPQESSLFRGLSAENNIRVVLEAWVPRRFQREQRLRVLLTHFGLLDLRETLVSALSGGQRRRLEVARAVAAYPRFLLFDEPLAGIDPLHVEETRRLIINMKKSGLGILITDHNVREALAAVDRAYIIHEGRVFMEGTPDDIIRDRGVRRVYLGERFRI